MAFHGPPESSSASPADAAAPNPQKVALSVGEAVSPTGKGGLAAGAEVNATFRPFWALVCNCARETRPSGSAAAVELGGQ